MARKRTLRILLPAAALALALALALLAAGCGTVRQLGTQVGTGSGLIDEEQAASINRAGEAIEKSFEDITPEQEYYIGRAVAATLLDTYQPLDDPEANRYLNLVGQTLAMASERPETFGGYHFLLLDSDEVNAFACPGGLILVCRGLVECCRSEDALAAVLAHEVAHVAHKDGLRAIKKSRLTAALTTLSVEAARNLGSEDLKKLTEQFAGSIDDVVQALVNNGYARKFEYQADAAAVATLQAVGYSPHALADMLQVMAQKWDPHGPGFMRTHPSPQDRIDHLPVGPGAVDEPPARHARFAAALGDV